MAVFENKIHCGGAGATMRHKISQMPKKSGGGRRAANKYPADCHLCGAPVAAGMGCIEKDRDGNWVVFC